MMKSLCRHSLLRRVPTAAWVLWTLAVWLFFQTSYQYHFFYQEQNQLFLLTHSYVVSYLQRPAWLSSLVGDFLTQYYYYLYAGAVILTLLLLLTGIVFRQALRRQGMGRGTTVLSLLVMTVVAACFLNSSLRLPSLLSLLGGAVLFLLLPRRLVASKAGGTAIFLCSLLAFWLFGFGSIVFLILALAASFVTTGGRRGALRLLIVPLFVGAVALCRPLYLMPLSAMLTSPGIAMPVRPELARERVLAADCEYYFGHDRKVISMVEQTPLEERMPQATYFYFLASARQGLLAEKLLTMIPGDLGVFRRIGPTTPYSVMRSMDELYYLLGDMTFAERAATLATVMTPDGRNVRKVKRLAEVNTIKGDIAAAMKYLRLLTHTMAYRSWAEQMMNGSRLRASYEQRRATINTRDTLRTSDNAYVILEELLLSNPHNEVALHYLLCSDLLMKELHTFKRDYDRFCMAVDRPRTEPLYQQALTIYLAATQASEEEWRRYIMRDDVMKAFNTYNKNRGSESFRDTYWYYYDRITPPKLELQ